MDPNVTPSRRLVLAGAATLALGGALAAVHGSLSRGDAPTRAPMTVGFTIVNAIGTHVVSDTELGADLDLAASLGATAVRLGCPFYLVGGVFGGAWYPAPTLALVARQVRLARERGLDVWLTLTAPVEDPDMSRDFDRFRAMNVKAAESLGAAVAGQVAGFQVLNEWNLADFRTGARIGDPLVPTYLAQVDAFLRATTSVLRRHCPTAVMTSALGGFPVDDARWAEWEALQRATGGCLDLIGLTLYPSPDDPASWPSLASHLSRLSRRSGKGVAVVEVGVSSPHSVASGRSAGVVASMLGALSDGGPRALFAYELRDLRTGSPDPENTFGIVTTDRRPKGELDRLRSTIVELTTQRVS